MSEDTTSFEQRGHVDIVPLEVFLADIKVGHVVEELLNTQLTLSPLRSHHWAFDPPGSYEPCGFIFLVFRFIHPGATSVIWLISL